jgi:8-oxo-dGTP pyrophosphatase MutT (NUDIX family)
MFTPAILHKGRFALADVAVTVMEDAWQSSPTYDALVRDAWQARVEAAAGSAQTIWDGTFYRVTNIHDVKDGLASPGLRLGTIPYRYIATYGALHADHAREGLAPLHHLTTAALVRTSDGRFLFGKRSRGGAIDLIGGGVQPEELAVTCGADLEANLRKEIHEELGVPETQIRDLEGLGVLLSSTSNVLVLGAVELALSLDEAAAQFPHRSDDEMSELVAVGQEELGAFLRGLSDYRASIPELMQI